MATIAQHQTHKKNTPILEARLLGPLEIRQSDGTTIELPRKVRALFAYLVTRQGTAVPRQTLLGLFWGERPEEQARASLRQALNILKKALGENSTTVFSSTSESVSVFDGSVSSDLELLDDLNTVDFQSVTESLVEYESLEFLEGLDVSEAGFQDWLRLEREKVRSQIIDLFRSNTDISISEGRPDIARNCLSALLRIEPCDEEAHGSLMRLHLEGGRTDAALQQFERCKAALQKHLNVEPSDKTTKLWKEVKTQRARSADPKSHTQLEPLRKFSPFALAVPDQGDQRARLEICVREHSGEMLADDSAMNIAAFGDAIYALQAAIEYRRQLREIRGQEHILEAFALDCVTPNDPAEPFDLRDHSGLEKTLKLTPPGEIDISSDFFHTVRRNSPCFFDDVTADHKGKRTFRVGRPMARQPFVAIYENATPRLEKRTCSLAVAPIKFVGPDPASNEYLVDGFTEDLILELSRTRRVNVSSRTTLEAIKTHDAIEIGRELGVGHVLSGVLRFMGSTVRMNFTLTDTETGSVIWSERYQQEFENIFEIFDEIVAKVVARISGKVEHDEIAAARLKRPENMTAYDYYLRGIWHHRMGGITSEHSRKAVMWLNKAIEIDPSFHRPKAMLCCAWSDLPEYNNEQAIRTVSEALEADPSDPEASRIMAWVEFSRGNYEKGIKHADRSIELAPHDAYLVGRCAVMHIFNGDPKKGLEYLRRAEELDPFVPVYIIEEKLTAYYALGDYEKVLSEVDALLHQSRRARYYAAASLVAMGRSEAARNIIRNMIIDDQSLSLGYVVGQELYRDKNLLKILLERLSLAGIPDEIKVPDEES